jgi:CubicO group peptidase (beta-lactamase class C family)
MHNLALRLFVPILLAASLPLKASEPFAIPKVDSPKTLAALDSAVKGALAADNVPGAAIVVIEQGKIVFSRSYGVADVATGRPVTADTIFRAGSVSKSFTALGIMHLVEQDRLKLDSPVLTLLPEWRVRNRWADRYPVRLANLLEHTSGLDDIRFRHYLIEGREITLTQAVPLFGPYELRWPPGHGTSYSNAGPVIAGRAIEVASGQDFEQFMTTTITGPLGMPTARWGRDASQANQLAKSYQEDGTTPEPFAETPGRPSGSLSASATDLARLPMLMLGRGEIDGRRVISRESVARMEMAATSVAARAGASIGWGLGLRPDANGRVMFHGHDGSIDGFVARFAYSSEIGAGYVVMANKASDAAIEAAAHIRNYLERDLPPVVVGSLTVTPEQRAAWAGQYQSTTPRQELLRAVIGVTQWAGAVFEGDVLLFERARWHHQGNGLFQRVDSVAPGLLFTETPSGVWVHTTDGTKRRVPRWEMLTKLTISALVVASLFISFLQFPFWLRDWAKGRFATRGSALFRFAPSLALACAVAVPASVLAMLASGDINLLGRPTFLGYVVFFLSIAAPAIVLTVGCVLWHGRQAIHVGNRFKGWIALIQWTLAMIVLAWLLVHGWIGIRIWDV